MNVLGGQLALVTILFAGLGLTALLWRGPRPILAAEMFGLAWLFGAGVVSALLAIGGIFLSGLPLFASVLFAVLALGITGFRRCRAGHCCIVLDTVDAPQSKAELSTVRSPLSPLFRYLALLAPLVPVLYITWASFHQAMTWDGILIWEAKARHAFLAGGHLPAAYFTDATRLGFHPSYPLYLPFAELWMYLWIGDCDQNAVKAIFPFFYAAAIALLWSTAFRLSGGHRGCAALAALLPLFIPMMTDHGFSLIHGYADFLLGTVYLAGVGALLTWRFRGVESGWRIATVCGALLPWIKQEGLFLFASLLALAMFVSFQRWSDWRAMSISRRIIVLALPGICVLVVWKLALIVLHITPQKVFLPLTVENLIARLPRLSPILYLLGHQLAMLRNWSLLWFLFPIAIGILAWPLRRGREALCLALAVFLPLSLDLVPYIFTRLDLVTHVITSIERLVLQLTPVAVLALALAAGDGRMKNEE